MLLATLLIESLLSPPPCISPSAPPTCPDQATTRTTWQRWRPSLSSYPSGFDILHVDALVLIQRDGLTLFYHLHLGRWHVLQGSTDEPAVPRLVGDLLLALPLLQGPQGPQQQPLLFRQHVYVLDASFQLLSGLEEEGLLSLVGRSGVRSSHHPGLWVPLMVPLSAPCDHGLVLRTGAPKSTLPTLTLYNESLSRL